VFPTRSTSGQRPAFIAVGAALLTLVAPSDADLLRKSAVSSAPAVASGGSYRLRATVSEAGVVGRSTGALYTVGQGFWAGHSLKITVSAPEPGQPAHYVNALERLGPNPSPSRVVATYTVENVAPVRLVVFDVHGRAVTTLVREAQAPGRYEVTWDGRVGGVRVASGVYFYRLAIGDWSRTTKVIIL